MGTCKIICYADPGECGYSAGASVNTSRTMGKTSEEIKKGLNHCSEDGCKGCNYKEDCDMADGFSVLAFDALAYIKQLEAREWDLFDLLSSAWFGKRCYFQQDNGTVYSRVSGEYMTLDQAIDEFAGKLTNERESDPEAPEEG